VSTNQNQDLQNEQNPDEETEPDNESDYEFPAWRILSAEYDQEGADAISQMMERALHTDDMGVMLMMLRRAQTLLWVWESNVMQRDEDVELEEEEDEDAEVEHEWIPWQDEGGVTDEPPMGEDGYDGFYPEGSLEEEEEEEEGV